MGLDVTAYSRLQHVGKHEKDPARNEGEPGTLDDWCYYDDHVQAYAYDCFPASFRGIPILGTKKTGWSSFFEGGCYAITPETLTHRFRAGSYGGYGQWRDDLRQQFNHATEPDRPFYELIFFADNEGSIGSEAARDLLADFREHADRYAQVSDWYCGSYQDWTRAFELAADGGLVHFH